MEVDREGDVDEGDFERDGGEGDVVVQETVMDVEVMRIVTSFTFSSSSLPLLFLPSSNFLF